MSLLLKEQLQSLGYRLPLGRPTVEADLERIAGALGAQVLENPFGRSLVLVELLPLPTVSAPALLDDLGVPGLSSESDLCFLDTETTGLSGGAGTQAFLVALAWRRDGGLLLRQHLLADPADEAAFLEEICRDLSASEGLVSYNGRTFDGPLLATRLVQARRDLAPLDRPHLDLLHPVRRIFRARLGGCRLPEVESGVLRRDRGDDIPGHLIPETYFGFLRHRDPELLRDVLAHNRQDVVSLSLLLDHLVAAVAQPWRLHPLDQLGVARQLEGLGAAQRAGGLYRDLWDSRTGWDGEVWPGAWSPVELAYVVGMRLATSLRRLDRAGEAADILGRLWRGHPAPWEAGIMLAKHLEHRRKDSAAALELVSAALAALESTRDRNPREERWLADLRRRGGRLSRRLVA